MKTIFYATDRTVNSAPALRYAYELSSRLGTQLVVFNTHKMEPIRVMVSRPPEQIEYHVIKEQKEILKSYCAKHLKGGLEGKNIIFHVVANDSVTAGIKENSKNLSADIVIIGRKDKHTDRGLFVGDIGKSLVENLSCPLLIVPNSGAKPISKILYATDFMEFDIEAIKKLVPIAEAMNAKVHLIHISTEKEYAGKEQMEWFKDMLQDQVEGENLNFKLIFSDTIDRELKNQVEQIGADLLVLLHREEKGFLNKMFHTSMVKKLEGHITIPLMSFNTLNL
ncbi:universal stress protein [Sediminicola arcticus]|jgi:nucleotide-binding universal stress UspA family protein|uniref:Universal stress protein n=1 Tax=Sediminicola arcticus TaxID=1574308 RepID=A0ABV2SSD4_9FLAO